MRSEITCGAPVPQFLICEVGAASLQACVELGPLACGLMGLRQVGLECLRDCLGQRVLQVWRRHQQLDRERNRSDLQRGAPLVLLEDVQADAAQLVDVWVENLCPEQNLGRGHRVLLGQVQFQVEHSSFVDRALSTV